MALCKSRGIGALLAAAAIALSTQLLVDAKAKPPDAGPFIENNIGLTVRPLTLDQLCKRLHARVTGSRNTPSLSVEGQTDRIVTVAAAGVEVEAYVATGNPVVIDRITVSRGGPALPMPLHIGVSTPGDVRKALGPAAEDAPRPDGAAALRYSDFEHTASVTLWFDDRLRLAGVEWTFDEN